MAKSGLNCSKIEQSQSKNGQKHPYLVKVATSAGNLIKILLPAQDPTGNQVARIHHFFLLCSASRNFCFGPNLLLGPKFFWTSIYFGLKISLDLTFLFWTQPLFGPEFFQGRNFFFDLKLFLDTNFFFNPNYYFHPKFFDSNFFFTTFFHQELVSDPPIFQFQSF